MPPLLTVDVRLASSDWREAMIRDALAGLTAPKKSLSPVWFYDERGSRLFDDITRLSEYYLTRAERSILSAHAADIAGASGAVTLVELGSGTSDKTRLLLDAMAATGQLRRFVPLDVSEEVLRSTAAEVSSAYGVDVHAVVGDFHHHLAAIPFADRRLVAFLGSTIGNLSPPERRRFFFDLDAAMTSDDRLLLGTDLVKDRRRLLAAYDDPSGVTAEFNRNVLMVLNDELGANFDPHAFDHVVVWNEEARWIEMRLRSRTAQLVTVKALDLKVEFAAAEDLLTEISAKFAPDQVEEELWNGGFVVEQTWTDPHGDFLLTLARPYC